MPKLNPASKSMPFGTEVFINPAGLGAGCNYPMMRETSPAYAQEFYFSWLLRWLVAVVAGKRPETAEGRRRREELDKKRKEQDMKGKEAETCD